MRYIVCALSCAWRNLGSERRAIEIYDRIRSESEASSKLLRFVLIDSEMYMNTQIYLAP